MAKCLVTGGAGFIGSHLCTRLLEEGHQVRVLDNFSTGKRGNLAHIRSDVELIEGDLRDLETVRKAVSGVEVVSHQGATPSVPRSVRDPLATNEVNVTGTLHVLLACRDAGVSRVVFASSSSVYGDTPTLPKVETMPQSPLSPYALQKSAAETYMRIFHRLYGVPTVSLRYFNVFGPRQDPDSEYSAVIPRFIRKVLSGEAPVIYGDGKQTRDFTFVSNAVAANLAAIRAPDSACGQAFNIACGESISLLRLVEELGKLAGTRVSARHEPGRAGDVQHSLAGIDAARSGIGYQPVTTFSVGLAETFRYYRPTPGS